MAVSKAQQKAVAKYMQQNYDEIKVRTSKGKKEEIKAHATAHGETINGFINRAISETIERDILEYSDDEVVPEGAENNRVRRL